MRTYGVVGVGDQWVEWVTLRGREDPGVKWTRNRENAYRGTEREAKAVSMLLPADEHHPLRVMRLL